MAASVAYVLGVAFTIFSGMCLALQTGVNATLARHAGSKGFAATASFLTGCMFCTVFMFIESGITKEKLPTPASIATAPWWSWFGGPLGSTFVITAIVFSRELGAATLVAIFVTCLLLGTIGLDLLGAVGFVQRSVSWQRMLGAAFLVVGTLLVTMYPGEVKDPGEAAAVTAAAAAGNGGGGLINANSSSSSSSMGPGRSLSGLRLLSWKSWNSLEGRSFNQRQHQQQQQQQRYGYSSSSLQGSSESRSGCQDDAAAGAQARERTGSFSITVTT